MLTFNFTSFPQLETNRLILRSVTVDDTEAIFDMRKDPGIMQYIGRPIAKSTEEIDKWIAVVLELNAKNEGLLWAIVLKNSNKLAGTICYWNWDAANHRAEIGYMLNAIYHRQGIMQEAITEVLQYGFNIITLNTIAAEVNPENEASINLLEKSGFVREGYMKQKYYFEGTFVDSALYGLINSKNNNSA